MEEGENNETARVAHSNDLLEFKLFLAWALALALSCVHIWK